MKYGFWATCLVAVLTLLGANAEDPGRAKLTFTRGDSPVETDGSPLPLTEPFLAADPADPRHLVAGAIVAPTGPDSPWRCAVFTTWNAGESWARHDFDMERCIDPWVQFTAAGDVLFAGIEIRRDRENDERFHLVLFRSEDGGRTWPSQPLSLGRAHDHALMTREASSGRIYLTSRRMSRTALDHPRHSIHVAASDDDGRTFRDRADLRPSNLALNPTGIATLSDGALVISFFDFQRNVDGFGSRGMLHRARAWMVRSTDGGETFSEPALITDDCASGIEGSFPGYPFLAADRSDRLYHACVRPEFDGVALTFSDDAGLTWSDPVRLHSPSPAHVRTPMLAVTPAGQVGVAWYDRRNDPERRCQDLYFTVSLDRGASFPDPVRVSEVTSCPDSPGNGRAGRSWPMGGDYSSITASSDGAFHLMWADSRSGRFRLRFATLRTE